MNILKIAEVLESYSEDVLAYKLDGVFANAVTEAVSLLISQGEQIADLQNDLRDERHRHDRYMAEAEELQITKEKLEQAVQDITLLAVVGLEGCDICAYNVGDKANCDQCDFTCNNCLMDCHCKECKHGLEFKWRGTDDV